MRHLHCIALTGWLLLPSAVSFADEPRVSPPYEGVRPGEEHPPPAAVRLERQRARRGRMQILTWPGFQMLESGGSRFFVQTTGPVSTQVRVSPGRIEVMFPNTTIHLRNSSRWLETRFFDTPVIRARLERRGRDMVFVMQMRADLTPRISTNEAGGFVYTSIDFERGHFLPLTEPSAPESGHVGVARESARALDDERPPVHGPAQ